MSKLARIAIPLLFWTALLGLIAGFSDGPEFALLGPDSGRLTLRLAHLTERIEPCRQLSEAERMDLPPTRRVSEVCQRPRAALDLALDLDGERLLGETIAAPGLHADRRIQRLQHWPLQVGEHRLELRLANAETGAEIMQHSIHFRSAPGAAAVLQVDDHRFALQHVVLLNLENPE